MNRSATLGQDPERGSGTVLGLALLLVGILACGAIALILSAGHAATRAGTAADLAALAAADTARGLREGEPCAVAVQIAGSNGAGVEHCALQGGQVVQVSVSLPVGFTFAGLNVYQARATARAGPPPLWN